jgi:AhpD family alkylhydroperoxidase
MKGKWQNTLDEIMGPFLDLAKLSPGIAEGKKALDSAGTTTNHLDPKIRELIAIAVGVTTRCNECVGRHVQLALKYKATQEEIAEAVGVAVALNADAAIVYAAKAVEAAKEMSLTDQSGAKGIL